MSLHNADCAQLKIVYAPLSTYIIIQPLTNEQNEQHLRVYEWQSCAMLIPMSTDLIFGILFRVRRLAFFESSTIFFPCDLMTMQTYELHYDTNICIVEDWMQNTQLKIKQQKQQRNWGWRKKNSGFFLHTTDWVYHSSLPKYLVVRWEMFSLRWAQVWPTSWHTHAYKRTQHESPSTTIVRKKFRRQVCEAKQNKIWLNQFVRQQLMAILLHKGRRFLMTVWRLLFHMHKV